MYRTKQKDPLRSQPPFWGSWMGNGSRARPHSKPRTCHDVPTFTDQGTNSPEGKMTRRGHAVGKWPSEGLDRNQTSTPMGSPPAELPGVPSLCKNPAHYPRGLSFPFDQNRKQQGPFWFRLWIRCYIPIQPHFPEKKQNLKESREANGKW